MKPVIFLNSHPIQYFSPLYKQISAENIFDLTVVYCSDETLRGVTDREFGIIAKWDIPLLEGYNSIFLKNNSFWPSLFNGFFGLANFKIFSFLKHQTPSLVIVHGWGYFTHFLTILLAKYFGHTVCLRAETPLLQEKLKNRVITRIKHFCLKLLFTRVDYFLYIGSQNKKFYQALRINTHKLFFSPYCVNNDFFQSFARKSDKASKKVELGFSNSNKIVLFSGKYINKKRPLDLINAFYSLEDSNTVLIMMGEGVLRSEMERLIIEKNLSNRVVLTGFINQSRVSEYYSIADVFVMCSGLGETWGLSVNEAINFNLPIVVSSTSGCAEDLVVNGLNGFVYETGNIFELSKKIENCLLFSNAEKKLFEDYNNSLLNTYSYDTFIATLKSLSRQD